MRNQKSVTSLHGFKNLHERILDNEDELLRTIDKGTQEQRRTTLHRDKSRLSFLEKERKNYGEVKMVPNNTDKLIDFNAHLQAIKDRTESQFPYTLTQAEDAMYIDKDTICTLEYHYIQNDCNYVSLQKIQEKIDGQGNLVDMEGNFLEHQLGTQYYQKSNPNKNPMTGFNRSDISNFQEDIDSYDILYSEDMCQRDLVRVEPEDRIAEKLKQGMAAMMRRQSIKKGQGEEMKETYYLEPFIGIYKVTPKGQMCRFNEIQFKFGRKYFPSRDGNMMLTMSRCQGLISIVNFDQFEKNGDHFALKAWYLSTDYREYRIPQIINHRLSEYYKANKSKFEKLVEITLIGCSEKSKKYGAKLVQMTYIEKAPRSIEEQLGYELEIKQQNKDEEHGTFAQRNEPRKASKYVFFDVETGEKILEYGGVQDPLKVENQNKKEVLAYMLGVQIKQTKEDYHEPKMQIFVAGDFLEEKFKNSQVIFKWAYFVVSIPLSKIMRLPDEERKSHIEEAIKSSIPKMGLKANKYFLFDENYILMQRFNWESSVTVAVNRRMDQHMIINQPVNKSPQNQTTVLINGPRFVPRGWTSTNPIDAPYFSKIKDDTRVLAGRNAFIKDYLFLNQFINNEFKANVYRIDMEDAGSRFRNLGVVKQVHKYISFPDCWFQLQKSKQRLNHFDEYGQVLSISAGDQTAVLETKFLNPIDQKQVSLEDFKTRMSSQFYQLFSFHPIVAYNMGSQRIIIQNTLNRSQNKAYIMDIPQDEKFICWIDFNSLADLGFYPEEIRSECCAQFAYLTTSRKENSDPRDNRINLLLVEPFKDELNVALFKSSYFIDDMFIKQQDFPIRSFLQATMTKKVDRRYSQYIWTQFMDNMVRSKALRQDSTGIDSDADEEEEQSHLLEIDEQVANSNKIHYLPNLMQHDDRDFIYYIVRQNGVCKIREGNPREPYLRNHYDIFEIKANDCLAFFHWCGTFYFMDDKFNAFTLTRNLNNRQLKIEKEMTMKEIQRIDFRPHGQRDVIMKDTYSILASKTFFFYDIQQGPHPEGIFEADDLIIEDRNKPKIDHIQGPILMKGTGTFSNVYRTKKFVSFMKQFDMPDVTRRTLINDSQNHVKFSSYMQDGNILMCIRRRFQVFDPEGNFLSEVEFADISPEDDQYNEKEHDYILRKGLKPRALFLDNENQEQVKTPEELRRGKEQILDFKGDQYIFNSDDFSQPLSQLNKMEIIQYSQNNRYFLFYNRLSQKLFVYELCELSLIVDGSESYFNLPDIADGKPIYQFKKRYELKFDRSYIAQHMYLIKVDPMKFFKENRNLVTVDNDGHVKISYVENLPSIENQHKMDEEEQEIYNDKKESGATQVVAESIKCRIVGSYFSPSEDFECIIKSFNEIINFPRDAQLCSQEIINQRISNLEKKIREMRLKQSRLPPKLYDYEQYENVIEDLIQLERKDPQVIKSRVYCGDLLIVFCGSFIKYTKVKKNKNDKKDIYNCEIVQELSIETDKNQCLKDINLIIERDFEIVSILETMVPYQLQLTMIDHNLQIMQIITWDFEQNTEIKMMQLRMNQKINSGYYVVKGMNTKMNYMIDQDYLTELECNMPIWQRNVNQNIQTQSTYSKQIQFHHGFDNQIKIYQDNSRFLGIENTASLFFNLSKLDVLYWQNVNALGEKTDIIRKSWCMDRFNLVFENNSMFHYFAANADIIEEFHKQFISRKQNGLLNENQKLIPLHILNTNDNRQNALQLSIANQSPKSFECLVDLVKNFSEQCISRLMLKSLNLVLQHESPDVINFFETATYQPPLMQMEMFVPWVDGMEEFVFPCHTAYIPRDLLIKKLSQLGLKDQQKQSKKKLSQDQKKRNKEKAIEEIRQKRNLRVLQLEEEFVDPQFESRNDDDSQQDEVLIKRVQVEALDFDWIFQEGNCKRLLEILAEDANDSALTKKTIKVFIDFMWTYYKKAIVKNIFLPYLVYLISLIMLSSGIPDALLEHFKKDQEDPSNENWTEHKELMSQAIFWWSLSFVLMLRFSILEIGALLTDGFDYFKDFWNIIDAISVSCNFTFLIMIAIDIYIQKEYINFIVIRTIGGFVNFFMWIKVFYWMRIFTSLAYYVNLITQTISDSFNFMLMVLIIICAFANFFYVLDINFVANGLKDSDGNDLSYFDTYFTNKPLDALISIYELGVLGNYEVSNYREGYDKISANAMFFIATFIITVVFMNMLIAIMSDTFAQVLEVSEERGLSEQVTLINDHAWLLNLDEIFKGQKYIIVVRPGVSVEQQNAQENMITGMRSNLEKKLTRMQSLLTKKIDAVTFNTRFMLNNQYELITDNKFRISKIERQFLTPDSVKQNQLALEDQKLAEKKAKAQRDKKKMIMQELNSSHSGSLSKDMIRQTAINWFELADADKSGSLGYDEFQEFFEYLEDIVVTEEEMRHIFDDLDDNGNGSLSIEEFTNALIRAIQTDDQPSEDSGSYDDSFQEE